MKVLFMGTPDFAVPCLKRLVEDRYEVVGVITQPDKPKGRSFTLTPPPVKEYALTQNIPVFQPQTLKDEAILPLLNEIKPEIIVVTAYGKILPEYVLNFPMYGSVNIHASLLPKYRGASPIQWSIVNGEKVTGITSMYMAKGLDTGDMILKSETEITENETAGKLHDKLSLLGAENLSQTLKLIKENKAKREVQDDHLSTYAPILTKQNTKIDWSKKNTEIYNFIRGLSPFPTAYSVLDGKVIKIISSEWVNNSDVKKEIGTVFEMDNEYYVSCGEGAIKLLEIIPEGKKKMSAAEFFRGHKNLLGEKFN
jgi:methionyl-tRNA formyltransferase